MKHWIDIIMMDYLSLVIMDYYNWILWIIYHWILWSIIIGYYRLYAAVLLVSYDSSHDSSCERSYGIAVILFCLFLCIFILFIYIVCDLLYVIVFGLFVFIQSENTCNILPTAFVCILEVLYYF